MISALQEKISEIKSLLKAKEGAQPIAYLESSYYRDLSRGDLFAHITNRKEIQIFISDINWVDFYEMFTQYNGTRCELTAGGLSHELMLNLKHTWSFNNSLIPEEQIDKKIEDLIDELENSHETYVSSEVMNFDAGGYDYSLIAIEFEEGTQVIEFLWYID